MAHSSLRADRETSLAARYAAIRSHSEVLIQGLSPEDCLVQSMPDASPVKWHLAHTTWFFETVILAEMESYRLFDPRYAYLFNSYYEILGPRHPRAARGLLTRPSLDDVIAFRRHVDAAMADILPTVSPETAAKVLLGLHHEQQHQELILTDIKHAFFCNPLLPAYGETDKAWELEPLCWISHPGGPAPVGHEGDGFAFDNEGPRHQVMLHPFRMASRIVTCGEYLDFIEEGGYRRPEFWLSDGWAMAQSQGWNAPLYWMSDDDGSRSIFTLGGPQPLDPHAPLAHVSFFEAAAYAAWAGKRLPTEFEWETIAAGTGEKFLHGDVWEWTRSSYDPYPGFRPFEGVTAEYNGKFMVGQMVLRGGSCATPPEHARATYRNFFPPQARWQFSGIRLAEDA